MAKYFEIICVKFHLTSNAKGEIVPIKKGTRYSVREFYGDYKIKDESSFVTEEQYKDYYMTLEDYRESIIDKIIDEE